MKKLIFILLAAAAISCGDRNNRSSERENDADNTETVEPDTTGMESEAPGVESDTTRRHQQQESDTLNNK
jgi:hypothetical protein